MSTLHLITYSLGRAIISQGPSAIFDIVQETENIDEEVDKVEIEADGTHDKLIRREFGVDHVGIIDDITTEQETSSDSENQVHCLAEWDKGVDKPSHQQRNKTAKQEGTHSREIILGLKSEQGQSDEYTKCDKQCLYHNDIVIEGDHYPKRECLH